MQSIGDLGVNESEFLTAEELRNITATPEEIFEERIENLKETFMQTMVKKATNEGVKICRWFCKRKYRKIDRAIDKRIRRAWLQGDYWRSY